jgi:hypothetical protein
MAPFEDVGIVLFGWYSRPQKRHRGYERRMLGCHT